MAGMSILGLKLPLRICVLEESVCVEDAEGRRTGYVYWSDDGQRRSSTGRFGKAEAIEQVRLIARAWADAIGSYGVPDIGPG